MSANEIKISICIPVYNCELFVKEAIDSVLSQSFTDFELIIVDNQSTDRTVEYIQEYNDSRIKFFQNETNIGMVGNWNKALSLAMGPFVKILPADDVLNPGCLQLQYDVLKNDTENLISLVCGRKNVINDSSKVLFSRGYSKSFKVVDGFEAINKVISSGGNTIGEPGSVMFRKEILEKTGMFDSDGFYVTDLSMWMKILVHGKLCAMPNILTSFRISAVSESIKKVATQKSDVDNFIKKIYNDRQYRLTKSSYYSGLINSFIMAQAKKVLYRFVL